MNKTTKRSILGYRHETRDISELEAMQLLDLRDAIEDAKIALDAELIRLHDDGVTRVELGRVLGISDAAIWDRWRRWRKDH